MIACLLPLPNWPIAPSTPQSRVVLDAEQGEAFDGSHAGILDEQEHGCLSNAVVCLSYTKAYHKIAECQIGIKQFAVVTLVEAKGRLVLGGRPRHCRGCLTQRLR